MTDDMALFVTHINRSYPFRGDTDAYQDDRSYGRRITNLSFSQADASDLTFEDTGETACILGYNFEAGLVVLCVRINHQWYALRPVYRIAELGADGAGDEVFLDYTAGDISHMIQPDMVELITTGDYKSEIDGLYPLIPRHNGNGTRRDKISHYCVGTDLIRKPGASVLLEAEVSGADSYTYTLTVTHADITTTVYTGTSTQLTWQSGDETLPADVWWRYGLFGEMPLWFDIPLDDENDEPDNEDIAGLYTIWPTYYNETSGTWSAQNKGYIHGTDGVRKTITQTALLFSGSPDYFRIQITVPSGGALRYNCELPDWSNQNGDTFIFTLDTNTSSASAPDEITVRRPQTGYCRTVKNEDQL